MRIKAGLAAAAAAVVLAFGAQAQDADCSVEYVVQPGDTLSSIAMLAYGSPSYQLVVAANGGKIPDPANPPIGETLTIPCIPGVASMTPDEVALSMAMLRFEEEGEDDTVAANPEAVATVSPVEGVTGLRLLTANGMPPFADQSLRRGGMATELAELTLSRLGILKSSRILFINQRDLHLQDLLIEGSFDLGFPWLRPACDQLDLLKVLSAEDAWLCENFLFSEPLYEFVYGFFVLKDGVKGAEFADYDNASICRPKGPGLNDLFVNGLTEDKVTYLRPETLSECFDALRAGEVDAVSAEALAAETLIAEQNLYETIIEAPTLSVLQTIHAIAPTAKPGSAAAIESFDRGLLDLKIGGDWFRIVGGHLAQN